MNLATKPKLSAKVRQARLGALMAKQTFYESRPNTAGEFERWSLEIYPDRERIIWRQSIRHVPQRSGLTEVIEATEQFGWAEFMSSDVSARAKNKLTEFLARHKLSPSSGE